MTSPCRFYLNKIQEVILLSFKIFRFNCCGLDVHKTWIYACIGITDSNGRTDYKQARFSSFSKGLKELCDWLAKYNCSEVCMESTGKYWIPVFNVLEKTNNSVMHLEEIEREILRLSDKYQAALDLIRTVPGFDKNPMTAIQILSEIGGDMSVFPSAKHLVSWAGCCPRNDQSNKRIKSTRISRAGNYIKPILVQVANGLLRSKKHPEITGRYKRIKSHRGHKKAIIAICRMLLTAIWHILSDLKPYTAEGFLESRPANKAKVLTTSQALNLLKQRGYTIKDDIVPAMN